MHKKLKKRKKGSWLSIDEKKYIKSRLSKCLEPTASIMKNYSISKSTMKSIRKEMGEEESGAS